MGKTMDSVVETVSYRIMVSKEHENPPPSLFEGRCHPLEPQMTEQVEAYFIEHWPFENERAIQKFRGAAFALSTCCNFPGALDDRISFACRLLTLLFLVDDLLEDMSFEEGAAFNARLMPIFRGDVRPDRRVPVEYIAYDLFEEMRACDHDLADGILEPIFTLMRAQTDRARNTQNELRTYLEYREGDVGQAVLSSLMRFVMGLHLSSEELDFVRDVDANCSKHVVVVNDIYSWEKEREKSMTGHAEGSGLCSSVQVMSNAANVSADAAKRILWAMCREWEARHQHLVAGKLGVRPEVIAYCRGLESVMAGNELWSKTTKRYNS